MNTEIFLYVPGDRPTAFWTSMGPFFGSKVVRKEMPYLVDDDTYTWFIVRANRKVLGFASVHTDKSKVGHLHGLYVVPEHRANGTADKLITARLNLLRGQGIKIARTTANARSAPQLAKHGFAEKSKKGSYLVMEVNLE